MPLGKTPRKLKIPAYPKYRHTDVAEPRGEPQGDHGGSPHFAEYETPQNVSKDRVSLSLRPLSHATDGMTEVL